MSTPTGTREFRLSPGHRRSGLYVTISMFLIGVGVVWIDNAVVGPNPFRTVIMVAVCWLIAAAGLLVFRWRLVVDERGIWRRRVWRWQLWSWEEFASGRMKYGFQDYSLVDPPRRRSLWLNHLSDADKEQIWRWIHLVLQTPQIVCPVQLDLICGFGVKVHMDASGVRVERRKRLEYDWSQLKSLEIRRVRHDRPDFRKLLLTFPDDDDVCLTRKRENQGVSHIRQNWHGAESEEIAAFVLAHVPPDRTLIVANAGPARTLREFEIRVDDARRAARDAFLVFLCVVVIVGVLFLWLWISGDWGFAGSMALAIIGLLLLWFHYRAKKEAYRRVQQAAMPAAGSNSKSGDVRG